MIFYYTCVGSDLRLLPPLLQHYRNLGLEQRLVVLNTRSPFDRSISRARKIVYESGALLAKVWVETDWNAKQHLIREEVLQAHCAKEDWVVTSDIDEFHIYPQAVTAMVEYCERKGYDYVTGGVIDRISRDGRFPVLRPDDLWNQFPLEAKVTENIMKACCDKVVLCRAWVKNNLGQHFAEPGARPCPKEELFVKVHHFKWDRTVRRRSGIRLKELLKGRHYWWVENDRFLRYLKENEQRLNVADPLLDVRDGERFEPLALTLPASLSY